MNVIATNAALSAIDQDYVLEDRYDAKHVFLTGTQALVRLPLEQARLDRAAGLSTAGLVTGYRGSPLAAYDSALTAARRRLDECGVTFRPAVNEDLAATALFGTQEVASDPERTKDGVFGIWYGKGPGVDRSGDALKHGNAFGASRLGGVLALLGDDHGCVSSSMPHQSDHALISFFMPVLHPASVGDYVPFGLWGIAASRFSGAWVGMKVISEVLESGATVSLEAPTGYRVPQDYVFPPGGLHHDPARNFGRVLEERMIARLDAFRAFAAANPLDCPAFGDATPKTAIIAVGKAHFDVMEALAQLGIDEARALALGLGVYKVGLVWPIESQGYKSFLAQADTVLVVEEKRAVVETQLRELLFGRERPVNLLGKCDLTGKELLPEAGELQPKLVAQALERALGLVPAVETSAARTAFPDLQVQKRSPFFCSGCPHNRSTKLPDGAEAFPGIGCHFMASWMPRKTAGLVQMGGEGVNWIGRSAYTKRRHMFQNLGDGTYFHSGLVAIRAAIAAGVSITYKILYNDAVAMTGGQPVDGSLKVEDIVAQLRGEGIKRIAVLSEDPSRFGKAFDRLDGVTLDNRDRLMPIQEELQAIDGVTAIVYDQGCAAEKRRKRKKQEIPDPAKRVFINQSVCEGCGDCSVQANCMSIVPVETEWGVKRQIDQSSCNKDFSCTDGFCPSFVTISGAELPNKGDAKRRQALLAHAEYLPQPELPDAGDILVAGIGGTGVVTIGAVLAMAAHLEGKGSTVLDFMGFAQKGGAVVSHLKVTAERLQAHPVRIGEAGASALIACDMVVATMPEALGALDPTRTSVIVNADVAPTGDFVTRGVANLEEAKRIKLLESRAGSVSQAHASQLAVALFGDSVYANMLLTGFAWQKGLLPVSQAAIERAIGLNGRSVRANIDAFLLGRLMAARPDTFADRAVPTATNEVDLDSYIADRAAFLTRFQSASYAAEFTQFVAAVRKSEAILGSEALTRVVARNLSRLMAYKDEYEVARLHLESGALDAFQSGFASGARLTFHLAPPMLSFLKTPQGRPRKFAIPGLIALPVLKILKAMRPLRGTPLDVFGLSHERRTERQLIAEYRALVEQLTTTLSAETLPDAIAIAGLADMIRGYGPVKAAALERYRAALTAQNEKRNTLKQVA